MSQVKDKAQGVIATYAVLCDRAEALGQVPEQIRRERLAAVESAEVARVEFQELYAGADGGQPDAARVRKAEQRIHDAEATAASRWEDRIEGAMLAARRSREARDEYLREHFADLEIERVPEAIAARDAVAADVETLRASIGRWLAVSEAQLQIVPPDVMGGDAGRIAFFVVIRQMEDVAGALTAAFAGGVPLPIPPSLVDLADDVPTDRQED